MHTSIIEVIEWKAVKAKSFSGMRCSIAGALELVGDRWTMLLIRDLSFGLSRYEDVRASTGIPAATLAARLKHLISVGLVERRPYHDNPRRDEYRLTPKGRDLWMVMLALREWGDRWDASGFGAPAVETVDKDTGRPLRLALIDPETGHAVPARRARLRPGPGADDHTHRMLRIRGEQFDAAAR
jgi:DNA-binding HxlR family transcriptional regulator